MKIILKYDVDSESEDGEDDDDNDNDGDVVSGTDGTNEDNETLAF